jgi:hypothetical protein
VSRVKGAHCDNLTGADRDREREREGERETEKKVLCCLDGLVTILIVRRGIVLKKTYLFR